MTEDKKYCCKNGDLIEHGKDYIDGDDDVVKILYINDDEKDHNPVKIMFLKSSVYGKFEIDCYDLNYLKDFKSLYKNKLDFKVGQVWDDGRGHKEIITKILLEGDYPIITNCGRGCDCTNEYNWHGEWGQWLEDGTVENNLVKLVEDVQPTSQSKEVKDNETFKEYADRVVKEKPASSNQHPTNYLAQLISDYLEKVL